MGGHPARRRPAARFGAVAAVGPDPSPRDHPGTGGARPRDVGTPGRASSVTAPADGQADELVVRVVPDVPAIHRGFDYVVPPTLAGSVAVGTEVRVVLHGRRVRAWVEAVGVEPPSGVALRPITAVRGVGPPATVLAVARWAAWRWAGPVVAFLRTASSSVVVRQLPQPAAQAGPAPAHDEVPPPPPRAGAGVADLAGPADPAGAGGPADRLAAEALAGGTAVVRVGPAGDRRPLLRAAAARLRQVGTAPGAGVLVLVPEAADVGAAATQLRATGLPVAVLPADWARARAGGCAVVGTRAAAWAPLPSLAAVVVLDAHEDTYVEQRAPTWSAWVVAAERARRDGAPCALVTPCPTLELLAAGRLVTPARPVERAAWPPVEVVDLRQGDPRHGLLSPRVAELGRWAVAGAGRRVAMVVNRTGGARLVACAACGEVARCETCRGPLELVDGSGGAPARLACRRCRRDRPVVCSRCGSTATRALRPGVRKLTRDLQALVGAPVLEVTAATRVAGDLPEPSAAPLVVGTEAALRGSGRLDAVVFLDFDGELLAPRLGAGEQALAGLARAARRLRRSQLSGSAGRAPGRLVVQTRQPDHAVLQAAVAGDPSVLAGDEEAVRRALRLPPFAALALLSGAGAHELADGLRAIVQDGDWAAAAEVDGPADGVWTLRAADHGALADLLAAVPRPPDRVRVDVDPVGL